MDLSKELFQEIINVLPAHLYWLDKNARIAGTNLSQALNFGDTSVEECIGKNVQDCAKNLGWTREFAGNVDKEHLDIIKTKKPKATEHTAIMADGKEHTYLSYKYPLIINKKSAGLVGISVDITQLKQTQKELTVAQQKAEAANRAKSEFLANMRHDIKTPFAGIVGMAEVLTKELTDPKLKKRADVLKNSSRALNDLIEDMMAYIDIESGNNPVMESYFFIKTIMEQVNLIIALELKEKNLELNVNYGGSIDKKIKSDQLRIRRILLNLVSNAIKFTSNGSVAVLLTIDEVKDGNALLKIKVSDTGIGIPHDKFDAIFEKFENLSSSHDGIYSGSGIGLSIVKCYIEDLGGSIKVHSDIDKGSTFLCTIPCTIDTSKPFNIEEAFKNGAEELQKSVSKKLNFLIIEDNQIACFAAKTLLESINCMTDLAYNGKEALEKTKKIKYDFILMDVGLPDINGATLVKKIETITTAPVIALTGHCNGEKKKQLIKNGVYDILIKPLDIQKLRPILMAIESRTNFNSNDHQNNGNHTAVDRDLFCRSCGKNKQHTEKMFTTLLKSLREHKKVFEKAFSEKDFTTLVDESHKLYGALCYCGTVKLQKITLNLKLAIENKKPNIYELYKKLMAEIDAVMEAGEKYLKK